MVGRWGRKGGGLDYDRRRLREAGADFVSGSLVATLEEAAAWKPVLAAAGEAAESNGRKPAARR